jgi:hypothetical protein
MIGPPVDLPDCRRCLAATRNGGRCKRGATLRGYCRPHAPAGTPEPDRAGLVAAAATGDRRAALEALRAVLANTLDAGVPTRDLPVLAGRLQSVMADLAGLTPPAAGPSPSDELVRRRASRLSTLSTS